MYCPECRSEYREGFVRCADCDRPLVFELPPAGNSVELVNVFETGDPSLIPVAESLLRGAGIEFLAKNDFVHATAPGASSALGPVQYWVARDDEAEVRALLEQLGHSTSAS